MPGNEFIDSDPLLVESFTESMRELERRYPEPRSRADRRRFKRAKQRLMRRLHIARDAATWASGQSHPASPTDSES